MVDAVVVAGDILRLGRGLAVGFSPAQQAIQRARQRAVRYFSMYRAADSGCGRHLAGFPPGEVALRRSRNTAEQRVVGPVIATECRLLPKADEPRLT